MTKNTCPYYFWFFGKIKITFPKSIPNNLNVKELCFKR